MRGNGIAIVRMERFLRSVSPLHRCTRKTIGKNVRLNSLFSLDTICLMTSKDWKCNNSGGKQCDFFVWVHEEENEKRRLAEYESFIPALGPRSPHTPWTLAKENFRKRKAHSREISDQNNESDNAINDGDPGPSTRKPVRAASLEVEEIASPSRKKARLDRVSTPGAVLGDTHELAASSLPSPQSSSPNLGNAHAPRTQAAQVDDRIDGSIVLDDERPLTKSILELLAEDGITLKPSTRIMLDHEIGVVVDKHEIETSRFQQTNSALRRKVDELMTEVDMLQAKVTELDCKIELWMGVGTGDTDEEL